MKGGVYRMLTFICLLEKEGGKTPPSLSEGYVRNCWLSLPLI